MKPETLARRSEERRLNRARSRTDLRRRLKTLAERDGPDSIWAEMLAEHEAEWKRLRRELDGAFRRKAGLTD